MTTHVRMVKIVAPVCTGRRGWCCTEKWMTVRVIFQFELDDVIPIVLVGGIKTSDHIWLNIPLATFLVIVYVHCEGVMMIRRIDVFGIMYPSKFLQSCRK